MIVQLRIDERLIHGQIAAAWAKALPIDTIICASDVAASDSLRTKMLLMAAPAGMRARVRKVDEIISLLSDSRADKMKILLITDSPDNANRLIKGLQVPEVNVANFHSKNKEGLKYKVTDTCVCYQKDYDDLKKLINDSKYIYSQMIPSVEKKDIKKLVETVKGE